MKQLDDNYMSEMLGDCARADQNAPWDDAKKCIKIKHLPPIAKLEIPRLLDLHGKTLADAMSEVESVFSSAAALAAAGEITRENNYFTVITGKAGEKKDAFTIGIAPGGIWAPQIKSIEAPNVGSYKIILRIPKKAT